jgi:iron complex transport system ATP-binding protein
MQPPLSGRVLLMGNEVHKCSANELAQQLSIVLTDRVDVGLMTAYALVALGRHPYTDWSGKLTAHDETVVQGAIEALNATELAHRPVSELSDGERQKIMIARALAQEPKLMILDEPTAFLDLPRRVEITQMLRNLAHKSGKAILMSTHDLDLALRSADRIWLMSPNGAVQIGAPEDLVLNGAFETAFHSEGVEFDIHHGSFKLSHDTIGRISLSGDGVYGFWTRRALEREGFSIVSNDHLPLVTIHSVNGQAEWLLKTPNSVEQHDSIYELLESIKHLLKT